MTTTLTFVAHQDDDLIFMNPDVASDEQAKYNVWVVYLTAGQDTGGMEYAHKRIEGARAAHARAAKVDNNWTPEILSLAGHDVATNTLDGTNVRLAFTYIWSASGEAGDSNGDLYRMWFDANFVAQPIDGSATYTRSSFLDMLRAVISTAKPDYIRTQNTITNRDVDHIDHISGALFAAQADSCQGRTVIQRDEYLDYVIKEMPPNIEGYWATEKLEIFNKYLEHDAKAFEWKEVYNREYRRTVYKPKDRWVPRTDHF
jgi:LmbE family N-acetylglucosaminyl deacetylase